MAALLNPILEREERASVCRATLETLKFDNRYRQLPEIFFDPGLPVPLK